MQTGREPLQVSDRDWIEAAACKDLDPEVFFPDDRKGVMAAKAICKTCVVREECLEYALNNRINNGIWGGASERERQRMLGNRR